jgi:hypothetical protein
MLCLTRPAFAGLSARRIASARFAQAFSLGRCVHQCAQPTAGEDPIRAA